MNSVKIIILSLLVSFTFAGRTLALEQPTDEPKSQDVTVVGDRVTLKVVAPKEALVGHPAAIQVTITNTSGEKIRYRATSPLRGAAFSVQTRNGTRVPYTRYGKRWTLPDEYLVSHTVLDLAPDESIVLHENVARHCDLSIEDRYVITVSWYSSERSSGESGERALKKLDFVEAQFEFEVVKQLSDATPDESSDVEEDIAKPEDVASDEADVPPPVLQPPTP